MTDSAPIANIEQAVISARELNKIAKAALIMKHQSKAELNPAPITNTDILADTLVRTLLALEVAYECRHTMPEHVQNLLKERIEEARESC